MQVKYVSVIMMRGKYYINQRYSSRLKRIIWGARWVGANLACLSDTWRCCTHMVPRKVSWNFLFLDFFFHYYTMVDYPSNIGWMDTSAIYFISSMIDDTSLDISMSLAPFNLQLNNWLRSFTKGWHQGAVIYIRQHTLVSWKYSSSKVPL